jgi:uncharacterized membrane protein
MTTKSKILRILWIIIGIIAVASLVCLIVLPQWKGIFLAGCGGFLILNLLMSVFFLKRNMRE